MSLGKWSNDDIMLLFSSRGHVHYPKNMVILAFWCFSSAETNDLLQWLSTELGNCMLGSLHRLDVVFGYKDGVGVFMNRVPSV